MKVTVRLVTVAQGESYMVQIGSDNLIVSVEPPHDGVGKTLSEFVEGFRQQGYCVQVEDWKR